MKRKKTGVRSPRKTSARPTREKKPKLREGGRQSSPFKSEWKYLDLSDVARDRDSTRKAQPEKARKQERVKAPPRAEVVYYKPPPKRTPFRDLTDEQVIAFYLQLPGDRRRRVLESTAIWKWFNNNKRDHKKLIAMQDVIRAEAVGTPPSTTEIAAYLRLGSGPPCSCGWMGYPYEDHVLDARKCFQHKPPELEDDDDDDDLPF